MGVDIEISHLKDGGEIEPLPKLFSKLFTHFLVRLLQGGEKSITFASEKATPCFLARNRPLTSGFFIYHRIEKNFVQLKWCNSILRFFQEDT